MTAVSSFSTATMEDSLDRPIQCRLSEEHSLLVVLEYAFSCIWFENVDTRTKCFAGEPTNLLGLVVGVGKSDHGRPTMNKSGRSTLGSKMGDQWSTIGRPLVAHYWSTKVDRPFSILLLLTRRVARYHLIPTRLQSSSSLSS